MSTRLQWEKEKMVNYLWQGLIGLLLGLLAFLYFSSGAEAKNSDSHFNSITGPSVVCGKQKSVSYIAPDFGEAFYHWSVSEGIELVSGQGSKNIEVGFNHNFNKGNLLLTIISRNSEQASFSKQIKNNIPSAPEVISLNTLNAGQNLVNITARPVFGAVNYNWKLSDDVELIAGQGSNIISLVMHKSVAQFCLEASNNCGVSESFCRKITQVGSGYDCDDMDNSIEKTQELTGKCTVYPNPAHDKLNLSYNSENIDNFELKVMDLLGNTCVKQEGMISKGDNSVIVDLTKIPRGVYVVIFKAEQGTKYFRVQVE